jgi:A/G-specific adenine glycosylase
MKKGYFSKKIIDWYTDHHRDLPWRNTQDPYKIWLSEIILQQTRVAQGLPYFEKFIKNYPTVKSLARADEREVLRLWQGLGYYTRARNLLACARKVVAEYGGKFPSTWLELKQLPGIGDYTAAAIASFAFHQRVAVVDGNVYRVLARLFGVDTDIVSPEGKRLFSVMANQLISDDQPGLHNQAIMEFGALHCAPVNPNCEECIFKKNCVAYQREEQHLLPVKLKKQRITHRYFYYFLFRTGDKILMTARLEKDIWKGLYDFPLLEEKKAIATEKVVAGIYPANLKFVFSQEYKHVLSHQVIHARFIEVQKKKADKLALQRFSTAGNTWYSIRAVEKLPKPRLILRYLEDKGIL